MFASLRQRAPGTLADHFAYGSGFESYFNDLVQCSLYFAAEAAMELEVMVGG